MDIQAVAIIVTILIALSFFILGAAVDFVIHSRQHKRVLRFYEKELELNRQTITSQDQLLAAALANKEITAILDKAIFLIYHNPQDEITFITNRAAMELFGEPAENIIGRVIAEEDNQEAVREAAEYRQMVRAISGRFEPLYPLRVRYLNRNGDYKWYEAEVNPILRDGGVVGTISALRYLRDPFRV